MPTKAKAIKAMNKRPAAAKSIFPLHQAVIDFQELIS
jgi:hypothetical protein